MSRDLSALTLLGVLGVVLLSVVGGAAFTAAGATAPATDAGTIETVTADPTNFTSTGSDELVNRTVEVTNDTRSVYVALDLTALSDGATTAPVNVTVSEVADDGTVTELDRAQISASAGGQELYQNVLADSGERTLRVTVTGNASTTDSSSVTVGTVERVVAGSGGVIDLGGNLGSLDTTQVGIGATVVALLYLYARRDD